MKLLKLKLLAFILTLVTIVSCGDFGSEEEYCNYSTFAVATDVSGPATATVNQETVFNVKINVGNNCGTFTGFNATTGFPKEVGAVVSYDGCNCPTVENIIIKEYKFTPTQAGEFQFKFLSGNNSGVATYITKTVTVTE